LLRSPQTAVHLVTLLEEMPVQETVDAVAELRATGLPVGAVIVNMTRQPLLPAGKIDRAEVEAGLRQVAITASKPVLDALMHESAEHVERLRMERQERKQLAAVGRTLLELPFVTDGIDLGTLHELSAVLRDQGVAAP
jgi:hypothetical protein